MTAIVFKAKVIEVFNHDNTFSHKEIQLPKTFKIDHIEGARDHKFFSGRIDPKIVDIRAKKFLSEMKIWVIKPAELPANVTVTGDYMATVRIEL
jgi:hypothetical protein